MMHRQRTRTSLFAAAGVSVLLAALAGCSTSSAPVPSSTQSGDEAIEGSLRVSTSANSGRPGLEAVAPLFQEETGVTVTTEFGELGSPAYTSQLLTQLQSGAAPDVFGAFPGTGTSSPNLDTLAVPGSLLDLSDTQWGQNVPEAIRGAVTYDDQVYAAILGLQFGALIYNTELFDQYGLEPPTTFDELVDLVGTIRDEAPDSIPISFGASNSAISMIVASIFAMNEPDFDPEDLDFSSSDAWHGGLEQLVELQKAGAYAPSVATDDANAIISQVTSGQSFMVVDVTSRYSAILRADPEAPIAMVPYPAADPEDLHLLIWPGTTAMVNAETENPAAARAWIDYITQPDINQTWVDAAGGAEFPPSQLGEPDAWPEQFSDLRADADRSLLIPAVSWPSADVGNALGTGVAAILLGAKSIDDVLAEMTAAAS